MLGLRRRSLGHCSEKSREWTLGIPESSNQYSYSTRRMGQRSLFTVSNTYGPLEAVSVEGEQAALSTIEPGRHSTKLLPNLQQSDALFNDAYGPTQPATPTNPTPLNRTKWYQSPSAPLCHTFITPPHPTSLPNPLFLPPHPALKTDTAPASAPPLAKPAPQPPLPHASYND